MEIKTGRLRVGIVGAGKGGKAILEIFHKDPSIEIAGIADIDPKAEAIAYARELGVPVTDDYGDLVKKDLHIIIDVTGSEKLHDSILRAKKPSTELMGGRSAWVLWKLVDERRERIEEKERVLKEREILYQLGLIVNNTNNMKDAGRAIVDFATQLAGTPAGSIALFDEKKESMVMLSSKGFSSSFEKKSTWGIRKGGITGMLFNRSEPLIIQDLQKSPHASSLLIKEGVRSLMAAPLTVEGRIIGAIYVNDFSRRNFSQEDVTLFSIFIMNAALILERIKTIEDMRMLSITDGLTGLYNHRYLMEQMQKEIQRTKRQKGGFSVLIFDIDHFKSYNDTYGHIEGNNVLKAIAGILTECARTTDTVARFGGEEFCVIALDTEKKKASLFVDRLVKMVAGHGFPNRKITLSGGVAFYPKDGTTPLELIEKADERLYKAKRLGRNMVLAV